MAIEGLKIDSDVQKENADNLGGGGFTLDSGMYPMKVDMAYLAKSKGGAMSLKLHLKQLDGRKLTIRETLWVTSGDAKGNKNYYLRNNKKHLLPGMILADQISKITAGKEMSDLTVEEKTIKLWNSEAGEEVPTTVPALTEMIDSDIYVGVHKVRANRVKLNAAGKYVDTNEERVYNEVHKVFHPDGFSVTEKLAGSEKPTVIDTWRDKFDNAYVNDQFSPVKSEETPAEAPDTSAVDNIFA